jgi:periplasmic protein TonB
MKTNLKLVVNTHFAQPRAKTPFGPTLNIRDLPLIQGPSAVFVAKKPSYLLLGAVILLHIAGMVLLVNSKTTPPEIKPVAPMMVSLVSNPVPEPEVVPVVPVQPEPKPVVKPVVKQKPIVKEKVPTPEPVVQQPVISEPVNAPETPPTPEVVMPKAPVVAEVPKVAPQPEVIEPPKFGVAYLNNPAPNYPSSSRRAGETGRVLLRVLVSTNGSAETVELENSSGFERLDEAAINAVKKWRFIPAKRSNQAVSAYVLVPVKFSLES